MAGIRDSSGIPLLERGKVDIRSQRLLRRGDADTPRAEPPGPPAGIRRLHPAIRKCGVHGFPQRAQRIPPGLLPAADAGSQDSFAHTGSPCKSGKLPPCPARWERRGVLISAIFIPEALACLRNTSLRPRPFSRYSLWTFAPPGAGRLRDEPAYIVRVTPQCAPSSIRKFGSHSSRPVKRRRG